MKRKIKKIKKFFQSKTFWANFLLILGGISLTIAGEIQAGSVITLGGVLNIVLRFLTKEPIVLK